MFYYVIRLFSSNKWQIILDFLWNWAQQYHWLTMEKGEEVRREAGVYFILTHAVDSGDHTQWHAH